MPMRSVPHAAAEVALARPVVHAMMESPRPWIREGLAAFAQALIRERQAGRRAALAYLGQFSSALAVAEAESHAFAATVRRRPQPVAASRGREQLRAAARQRAATADHTADEVLFRTKAAYVWWMLRDIGAATAARCSRHWRTIVRRMTATRIYAAADRTTGLAEARSGSILRRLGLSRPGPAAVARRTPPTRARRSESRR